MENCINLSGSIILMISFLDDYVYLKDDYKDTKLAWLGCVVWIRVSMPEVWKVEVKQWPLFSAGCMVR